MGNDANNSDAATDGRKFHRRSAYRSRGRAARLVRLRGSGSVGHRTGVGGCAGRGPQGDNVVSLLRFPQVSPITPALSIAFFAMPVPSDAA